MSKDWSKSIHDPDERRVFEALADINWDFRTIDGISKSVNLPAEQVSEILRKYEGGLIRKSKIPDAMGRDLFTLCSDETKFREMLDYVRVFTSKTLT